MIIHDESELLNSRGARVRACYKLYLPTEPLLNHFGKRSVGGTNFHHVEDDDHENVEIFRMDQTVLEASEICSNGGSLSVGSTKVPHGPIPELFLSTRALSPSENDFANETLLDAKSRLLHLDIKLTRAQKTMAELQDQRTSLQRHIVRYLWLLSPVRRLPLEILWEIFMFCVPDDTAL